MCSCDKYYCSYKTSYIQKDFTECYNSIGRATWPLLYCLQGHNLKYPWRCPLQLKRGLILVVTQEPATNPLSLSSDWMYDGNIFIYLQAIKEFNNCTLHTHYTSYIHIMYLYIELHWFHNFVCERIALLNSLRHLWE